MLTSGRPYRYNAHQPPPATIPQTTSTARRRSGSAPVTPVRKLGADHVRDAVAVRDVLDRMQQQCEQHAAEARADAGQDRDDGHARERAGGRRGGCGADERSGRMGSANGIEKTARNMHAAVRPHRRPAPHHETNVFFESTDAFCECMTSTGQDRPPPATSPRQRGYAYDALRRRERPIPARRSRRSRRSTAVPRPAHVATTRQPATEERMPPARSRKTAGVTRAAHRVSFVKDSCGIRKGALAAPAALRARCAPTCAELSFPVPHAGLT